jgi:ATP-binding cassette, subfamily A (ABC1), member 3
LGDRIAIMSRGALKCCGSPLYLKSKYGSGYTLTLTRKRPEIAVAAVSGEQSQLIIEQSTQIYAEFNRQTQSIIKLIKSIISSASLNSNINTEISFILPSQDARLFPALLDELEKNKESLSIVNIGVSVTTVEDVFLRIGEEESHDEHVTNGEATAVPAGAINSNYAYASISDNEERVDNANGITNSSEDDVEFGLFASSNAVSGFPLLVQQFWALIRKRLIHSLRNKILIISQLIIPIGSLLINLYYLKYGPIKPIDSSPLKMDISVYKKNYVPYLLLNNSNFSYFTESFAQFYSSQFEKVPGTKAFDMNSNTTVNTCLSSRNSVDSLIECLGRLSLHYIIDNYIIACTLQSTSSGVTKITAHFNNQPYHTPALALNAISNALLKYYTNSSESSITVINHPLPRSFSDRINDLQFKDVTGFNVASGEKKN